MILAVRWGAVLVGVAAGAAAGIVLGVLLAGMLTLGGGVSAALAGVAIGTLLGMGVAGYTAGRLSPLAHRFHGSLAALGVATLVLFSSLGRASPAGVLPVVVLLVLAAVLGGIGGIVGGRRRGMSPTDGAL